MSIMGIGPKLALFTVIYIGLLVFLLKYYSFTIAIRYNSYVFILGISLIVIGILFLVASVIALLKARTTEFLCVKGVYSVCRNPIYSSWIIFIVPGIALMFDSLILLTIPIVMYSIFSVLIKQEEAFLLTKFGEDYLEYKKNVGSLFPKFWKYHNS